MSNTLKYTVAEAGFPVYIEADVKELGIEQLREVVDLVLTYSVVVFRNQDLDVETQKRICTTIGSCTDLRNSPSANRNASADFKHSDEHVLSVMSKNFFNWHSDDSYLPTRKALHWLYSVEGTVGSRTSWINTAKAYKYLPETWKERLEDLVVYSGYKAGLVANNSKNGKTYINEDFGFDIITTNKQGVKGIYFPFLQVFKIKGYTDEEFQEVHEFLQNFFLQEEFVYHHDWQDGDLIISDQWHSLHKRWEVHYEQKRHLNRVTLDYDNIYGKEDDNEK